MTTFVEKRIREREGRLAAIDTQVRLLIEESKELEIELRAYRDVLNHEEASEDMPTFTEAEIEEAGHFLEDSFDLKSRMSETWKNIMRKIAGEYPHPLHMDAIRVIALAENSDISNDTLRSQLSTYTTRGWLERTSFGKYRVTPDGGRIVGYKFSTQQAQEIFKTAGGAANNQQNPD